LKSYFELQLLCSSALILNIYLLLALDAKSIDANKFYTKIETNPNYDLLPAINDYFPELLLPKHNTNKLCPFIVKSIYFINEFSNILLLLDVAGYILAA
jgi:hypothetical protein